MTFPSGGTHSLEEIGKQCVDIDPAFKGLADQAAPLSEYAWRFRYPGQLKEPTEEEAEEALQTARAVYDAVLIRLPKEVRP